MLSNLAELISAEDNLIPCWAQPQEVEDGAKSSEHGICNFFLSCLLPEDHIESNKVWVMHTLPKLFV